METFTVKIEPGLQDIKGHEYHIKFENYKPEQQLNNISAECRSSEGIEHQPDQHDPKAKDAIQSKKIQTKSKVIQKSPRKTQNKEKAPFTIYLKKRFLNTCMDNDCTSKCLQKSMEEYNVNQDEVKEYFAKAAQEAQDFVHQECDSLCFSNITEWLKYLKNIGAHRDNNYESAIVMNAIVNNESQPQKHETAGVDLKSIYKFINNGLMGLPQKPLDSISAKFLSSEFQNLINEANTDDADNDVRTMKAKLETALSQRTDQQPSSSSSLDPLKLTDTGEMLRICETAFKQRKSYIVKTEK